MTLLDWRANRLADGLAKAAAQPRRIHADLGKLLHSFNCLALHDACLLGRTTAASNACRVEVVQPDGSVTVTVKRDATPKPKGQRSSAHVSLAAVDASSSSSHRSTALAAVDASSSSSAGNASGASLTPMAFAAVDGLPCVDAPNSSSYKPAAVAAVDASEVHLPSVEFFRTKKKQTHRPRGSSAKAKAQAKATAVTNDIVSRIGSSASASATIPASLRIAALRARVRAKEQSLHGKD